MALVWVIAKYCMFPKASSMTITQVITIQPNLIIGFGYGGPILGKHAIISQEGRDHIDKVRPKVKAAIGSY